MIKCILHISFGSHNSEAGIHSPTPMMVGKHMQYDRALQWSSFLSVHQWIRHCTYLSQFTGPPTLRPATSHSTSDPLLLVKMLVWLHNMHMNLGNLFIRSNNEFACNTQWWSHLDSFRGDASNAFIISINAYITICISSKLDAHTTSRVTARVGLLVLTCLT